MSIKKGKYCTKYIEGILKDRINIKHLEIQKPSIYDYSYEPILKHFRSICQQGNKEWLTCGAHQAYTWMPSRVNLKLPKTCKNCALSSLQRIISHKDEYFTQHNDSIEKQLIPLRNYINNSIVGTSKFLHFSFPEIFPIWDSKVESAFPGKSSPHRLTNNKKTKSNSDIGYYIKYAKSVHQVCKTGNSLANIKHIKLLHGKSSIRKVEQALFLIGGKK